MYAKLRISLLLWYVSFGLFTMMGGSNVINSIGTNSADTPADSISLNRESVRTNNPEENKKIDWKVGPQLSGLLDGIYTRGAGKYKIESKTGYGFGVGVVGRMVFNNRWVAHTSLDFSYISSNISTLIPTPNPEGAIMNRLKMSTLSWPIMGGYRFAITDSANLSFMGGIALNWALKGKIYNRKYGLYYPFFGVDGVWKKTDFQLCFGYAIEMDGQFMISGTCYFGMLNLGKSDIFNYKWNGCGSVTMSFAYLFGKDSQKRSMTESY
ncbi:MAG: outer membrane beta-barrel protein [Bacteroidales bacterium]|nr:outer membrane beta-barrel protein [Bacteroidales bacterium]